MIVEPGDSIDHPVGRSYVFLPAVTGRLKIILFDS